jgi:hypothetical protein
MTSTSAHALAIARPIIRGLTILNILYGAGLVVLLGTSVFFAGWPERPLGFDLTHAHPHLSLGLRTIVAIGIVGAAIVHTVLRRLLAIVDTVRGGDPFIVENARRLDAIAWSVLVLELLRMCVLAIAAVVWEPGRLGGFSFAPWLAVLLLFVLSGVFAQGARMRADLEGTV